MGNFTQWLKRNRLKEDFEDDFKFDDSGPRDYEKDVQELGKVLASKYYNEFTQFVKQLGDERGDKEVLELLEKVKMEKKAAPVGDFRPHHEPDMISTPKADRGADPNNQE